MKNIKLSNRLQTVASFIEPGAGVIDVGTDHGFLPVWLAQSGAPGRIVASDVGEGPLQSAVSTADAYGVVDRIEFVRTDGLEGIDPSGIGTVVLAGMGGETMIAILEKAPWVKSGGVRLVLQPQTKQTVLTGWLKKEGFVTKDAALCRDDGRLYLVLCAVWDGGGAFLEPVDILLDKREPLLPEYLDREIARAKRALAGQALAQASGASAGGESGGLRQRQTYLEQAKGETDKWQR